MKKTIIFLITILLLNSCSSDKEEILLTACIESNKERVEVGEKIIISNCSKNFASFEYSYYDDENFEQVTSTETTLELSFARPGEYNIVINAFDNNGNRDSNSITITVNDFTENLIVFDIADEFQSIPLGAGIDSSTGKFYYIDLFGSIFENSSYYYRELDNDYKQISQTFLRDQTENSGLAVRSVLSNGDKIINTVNTFSTSYFSREILINSSGTDNVRFTDIAVIYGNIEYEENKIFFGSDSDFDDAEQRFKNYPAIEIRDENNAVIETKIYRDLDFPNAIIADMIATNNGYIGFGGSFGNDGSTLTNYTPLIIFFDNNLEITATKSYSDSDLTKQQFLSYNNLNSAMSIENLSSNKFVIYGMGEIRIIDINGETLFSELIDNPGEINDLLSLGDSFIVSTRGFLRKYDASGALLKKISAKNDLTPNLILNQDAIIFISAFQSTDANNIAKFQPFIGSVDLDLNFINLNL